MKTLCCLCILTTVSFLTMSYCQNHDQELTNELQDHFKTSDLPGFVVAIVTKDGTIYKRGFGFSNIKQKRPFNTETILNLGSVSKTVVGLALIKAIKNTELTLESNINDYLPFKVINPYFSDEPILVKHLITHTSGILDTKHYGKSYIYAGDQSVLANTNKNYLNFIRSHEKFEMSDFLSKILGQDGQWYKKKNFLKAKPGVKKEYANLNAALIALILEKVTGVNFKQYTKESIFNPLNMGWTGWSINAFTSENLATRYFPDGSIVPNYSLITYPDGGLYSSIDNLGTYLSEIIKAYVGESDFLKTPFATLLLPGDTDNTRAFWGIGQKSRNIGHGGSDPGIQTDLQFNADSKIGRIIMCNVNAEDHEVLWKQYRTIHTIIAKYETKLNN